jgi:3-deoxy-manno-octulosonate cytidylyltransferase (CMP-KDO synthetase)
MTDKSIRIVAVIPAHLASVRFPGKILHPFHGLPMIEHVRRRALLCEDFSDVFVATCDREIADVIEAFGGKVIMTSDQHLNGTSRVAEAVREIDCTHVVLLQGDEPLLLPRHLEAFIQSIFGDPTWDAWNATGPIKKEDELDRHSFVKCAVSQTNRILYCFRRSPCYSSFDQQVDFIRKVLGIIAFGKEFILKLTSHDVSLIEKAESIEQMRMIEHGYRVRSVPVSHSLPSVNEPGEAETVLEYIEHDAEQKQLLDQIIFI